MRIYKFPIDITNNVAEIVLPCGARPLSFHLQREIPTVWAEVDPTKLERPGDRVVLVGTGHPAPVETRDEHPQFIGTVLTMGDGLVLHAYHMARVGQ